MIVNAFRECIVNFGITVVADGHGFGLDLMNTLHFLRGLGTLNSTSRPNPSSSTDFIAVMYLASVQRRNK